MALIERNKKVGSIGAAWPPFFDSHNNRVKGFYPRLVTNRHELRSVFEAVKESEEKYQNSTRTTVRAFVRVELIEGIRKEPVDGQLPLETVLPVENAVPGYAIAYFGKNAKERMPDAETWKKEMASIERVRRIARVFIRDAAARVAAADYHITSLGSNEQRKEDVSRLLALYREAYERYTFDINEATISEMLDDKNIVIVGRNARSEIVSSLIAEHCTIELEQGPLVHLYELSDYATFRADRGNGLITLMQMDAVNVIRRLHPLRDAVIYAEDRASWEAVNISSQKAGLSYCGTLLQHCVLVSDRSFGNQGIYEDLNVWAALD